MVFGNSTFTTNENTVFASELMKAHSDGLDLPSLTSIHFSVDSFEDCTHVLFESVTLANHLMR